MCSMRASPNPSKMSKSLSFRGLRPWTPPGHYPGPHQGPLSEPLDLTPLYAMLPPFTGQYLFLPDCPTNDFGVAPTRGGGPLK